MARWIAALLFFLAASLAALAPTRSYDYFWHLAAGRWIADHHALPRVDPLAVASSRDEWINGEWLYELALQAGQRSVGDQGISFANALLVASIFTAGLWFRQRPLADLPSSTGQDSARIGTSLLIAAVALAGGSDRLGVRPSTAAAFLLVVGLILLGGRLTIRWLLISYSILSAIWMNVHPSAILAPFLALATLSLDRRRVWVPLASAAALLINPYGWKGVVAPIRLATLIQGHEFVNAEWLPSPLTVFPLFYFTMAAAAIWFFTSDRSGRLWRIVIFAALAVLAIRSVRNQGLYFASLPLLLPQSGLRGRGWSRILAACALVPIAWIFQHDSHQPGIDASRFPVAAVHRLAELHLPGNIYNADQFGGLLEWTFYPHRRVLTDGRNELFRDFIAADARAHRDSRAWRSLLERYQVALAVDEYQNDRIDVMDVASGQRRSLPASLVRYRRRDWALIAFDDAAMVFARRASFPAAVLAAQEYRYLVPDDSMIRYPDPAIREAAIVELRRAHRELGASSILGAMEKRIRSAGPN